MQLSGQAVLKLIGASQTSGYKTKAVVLKEKSLYVDIIAYPKDSDKNYERVFIEFQGYEEKMIRYITSSKVTMSCAQDQYTGPVLIAIVYTDKKYKDKAFPLSIQSNSANSFIKGEFKEIVISDYSESQLIEIDPRLIVLAPFTVDKKLEKKLLAKKCYEWKQIAINAYKKDHHISSNKVIDVMAFFLINRFSQLTLKEIRAMFDFDLSETKAGEELIEIGREEGREEGMMELLLMNVKFRFGNISPDVENTIKSIKNTDLIRELFTKSFSCKNVEQFIKLL